MNNNTKALTENGSKMIIVIMMIMIIIMMVTITHLFPMQSFLPPENIRKPLRLHCEGKGCIGNKWVNNNITQK